MSQQDFDRNLLLAFKAMDFCQQQGFDQACSSNKQLCIDLKTQEPAYYTDSVYGKPTNPNYDWDNPLMDKAGDYSIKIQRNMINLKKIRLISRKTKEGLLQYIKELKKNKVANCEELAMIALYYLNKSPESVIRDKFSKSRAYFIDLDIPISNLNKKFGHTFLIVDTKNGIKHNFPRSKSFFWQNINCSNDAVVCDPWVNIVCGILEYIERWKRRMENYNIMQLRFQDGGQMIDSSLVKDIRNSNCKMKAPTNSSLLLYEQIPWIF
ncbi:MAG: hypothetical protein GY730_09150 [bacterium]|nr:hypothetical protein [bacterium]